MNKYQEKIESLLSEIADNRTAVVSHPLFSKVKTPEHISHFMQSHVWAVWDFMSLLKALQIELTSTKLPWMPKGNADIRYLINEIVTGEESDLDESGNRMSHFEMYLEAMHQCGADRQPINTFMGLVSSGTSIDNALDRSFPPGNSSSFVKFTFDVIRTGKPHVIAAVFTFGREDLIPDMFTNIVSDLRLQFPNRYDKLDYYLQRHIDVDGDHHGQLALEMVAMLCGDDSVKWEEATSYSLKALDYRRLLWDGVLIEMENHLTNSKI